jgi:hypothetical protein
VLGAAAGFEEGTGAATHRAANIVYIKNESGYDVPECGVLGISGVAFTPVYGDVVSGATAEFFRRPVLTGVTPSSGDGHADAFVVTVEPIAANGTGRAAIGGVFPCRVHVTSLTHRYATIKDGDRTRLQSALCGIVQIPWKSGVSGDEDTHGQWAVGVM